MWGLRWIAVFALSSCSSPPQGKSCPPLHFSFQISVLPYSAPRAPFTSIFHVSGKLCEGRLYPFLFCYLLFHKTDLSLKQAHTARWAAVLHLHAIPAKNQCNLGIKCSSLLWDPTQKRLFAQTCLATTLQGTAWSSSQLNRGHSGRLSALFSFVLDIRKCPPFRRSHYLILERHIQVWLVRPLALHLASKGWCWWWCTGGALSSNSRFVCHRSVSLACVCWVSNIQGKKKKKSRQSMRQYKGYSWHSSIGERLNPANRVQSVVLLIAIASYDFLCNGNSARKTAVSDFPDLFKDLHPCFLKLWQWEFKCYVLFTASLFWGVLPLLQQRWGTLFSLHTF